MLLFSILSTPALASDLYGAIAVGPNYRRAFTSNHATYEAAEKAVMAECGSSCMVAVWYRGQTCAAVVMDAVQHVHWSWSTSVEQAEVLAQQRCKSAGTTPCYTIQLACNSRNSGSGTVTPPWTTTTPPVLETAAAPAPDPAASLPVQGGNKPPR